MSALRRGLLPQNLMFMAARASVIGPLVLAGACASNKQPSYVQGPGHQVAMGQRKVEMEDDGQPVQPPPARIMSPAEDDPQQPWSPNYGKGVIPQPVAPRTPSPNLPRQQEAYVPAPVPVSMPVSASASAPVGYVAAATTTGSIKQLSAAEADDVVARAMTAHEIRKR